MKISFLSNRFELRAVPIPDRVKAFLLVEDLNISNKAGVVVKEETAMRTSFVYACVRIIAETVASLPLHLYKKRPRGKEKATYHPLYTVLHNMPNSDMASFYFRETLMTHLLLWGNAYDQITRRGNQMVEIWPLHPAYVRIEREPVTNKLIYKYTSGTQEVIYTGKQRLHIRGLSIDDVKGVSPISMARETIDLAQATEEFGSRFFSNGARPEEILQHLGIVKDPERLRKSWEEVYKGVQNSHKIAVLEEGMQYKEIGISSNDAQFL